MRHVILDTETTGLDPKSGHRLIEIGCVEVISKLKTGKVFHSYINPERNVPDEAFKVHKISTQFLQDKPKFKEIAEQLMTFIGDSHLIIHNAPFDLGFLNHELKILNLKRIENAVVDTLPIARKKFPGAPANLNALCKRFNINLKERHASGHGALLDSELLYHVYICLTEGVQSEFLVNTSTESKSVQAIRDKIAPREFVYAEDLAQHETFIASIKGNLWR